jgi:mannitol-specific phosphotransferase system IIBC component
MMLLGGSIAAPVSAWLVRRFDDRALGTAVGALIILLNIDRVLLMLGMASAQVTTFRVVVVALSAIIVGVLIARGRARIASALPQPV